MQVPALLLLILLALLPPAGTTDPSQPCPSEMNSVKDILEVNCTGQALSTVPLGLPVDTGILLLSANHLVSLTTTDFQYLTQLQDLDLSNNRLVSLYTEPPLLTLKELILSHNELRALPALKGLPELTHLAVAHNCLVALAPGSFSATPKLKDLDLRGNQLRTLPMEVFIGLTALEDLDLSDNHLEELPKELLQDLHALQTLWLSGNRLQALPTGFFPKGHFFLYVFLTENLWHCDCRLRYLQAWIWQNSGSVYQPERGLEKTKVEVAPKKVLCHSPAEHQRKPVMDFKANCRDVGDVDVEEEDDYDDEQETVEKVTMVPFSALHPSVTKEHTTMPHVVTWHPLATRRPPLSTPFSSTGAPSTSLAMPASTRAPSTTIPAPAIPTVTSTQTPSTAAILTEAPASTPHTPTTLVSTTSLPITVSTSSHPQTTLTVSTTNTCATLIVSTGLFSTTSRAVPSTAALEASSIVRSSSPPLMPTAPVVSNTMLSTHAPTPSAPLNTTRFTPPAPLPFCPCFTPGLAVPVLHSQVGGEGPQWGLRHCCLLHWVLYLASFALLVLTVLALAGWLAWMCLVGRPFWHKSLQTQEVQYPLLRRRESTGSPVMHLSSFKSPLQRPTFCTIKEVELCPEVTYCTIKDLGIQGSPPARSSFCTTKELWVHHSPLNTSFKSFSKKPQVTNLSSLRTPSAYSLDRGAKAIGDVRVKYAGNTL